MSNAPIPREGHFRPEANHLLSLLPDADLERLVPHLEPVSVDLRQVLHRAGDVIHHVYFPVGAVASALLASTDGLSVETLAVAREGTTGLPVFLGSNSAPLEVVWQVAGEAGRMPIEVFRAEVDRRGAMFEVMQRYAQFVLFSTGRMILCARHHMTESRAARLLLQLHDAVARDTFALTQEYFAALLGVHRPSVTVAAGLLQGMGAVSYRRGVLTILERERLEEVACDCYGVMRNDYLTRVIRAHAQ